MQTDHRARLSEQGGAVSFIIITLALAALLFGGFTFIKSRADQAANNPPQVAQQGNNEEKKPAENTQPSTQNENTPRQPQENNETQASGADTPAPATPPAQTPAPQAPTAPAPTTTQPSVTPHTGPIAASGPTESAAAMLILGLLAAMVTRYLQSRHYSSQQ